MMDKTISEAAKAGREATSFVVLKTTGDNHPRLERAIVDGQYEAIKEMAKSDGRNAEIYQKIAAKRQSRDLLNVSSILNKFAKLVPVHPKKQPQDDNDFFWNMWDHAKTVSDDDVQNVIAKILAREYQEPNSFPMSVLKRLEFCDKGMLEKIGTLQRITLSGYVITNQMSIGGGGIFSDDKEYEHICKEIDFNYSDFLELQNLGFILSNESSRFIHTGKGEVEQLEYMDKVLVFESEDDVECDVLDGYAVSADFHLISEFIDVKENLVAKEYVIESVEKRCKNLKFKEEENVQNN